MGRGQFIRTAGMGAAAIGAASMGFGGVARANIAFPTNPAFPQKDGDLYHALVYPGGYPLVDANDPATFEEFFALLKNVGINLTYMEPGTAGTRTVDQVASGQVKWGAGLTEQAGKTNWKELYWHQPFVATDPNNRMTPEKMMGWLYYGGGLKLRQKILDKKYDGQVVAFPIRINPGEKGCWFVNPITYNEAEGKWGVFYPNTFPSIEGSFKPVYMRASGAILVGIMQAAGYVSISATPGGTTDLGLFNPDTTTLPIPGTPINGFEFHFPSTDLSHAGLFPPSGNNLATFCKYYYKDTWYAGAAVWEVWINRDYWENELTQPQRNYVEYAARLSVLSNLAQATAHIGPAYSEIQSMGVTMLDQWPQEFVNELYTASQGFYAGQMADPDFKEVFVSMRKYLDRGQ